VRQQPSYPDEAALERVLGRLSALPPLVTPWEVDRLRLRLAEAAAGQRFLLQGGDCAERFDECRPDIIANRLKVLLQMSLVLIYGMHLPVIRVGRFAGQYAKPRSDAHESKNGTKLPSYRGDIINRPGFGREDRIPDPNRMIEAYYHSAVTLNHIRALGEGGFADLHHPENWDLGFVEHEALRAEYQEIVDAILEAIRFMEAVSPSPIGDMDRVAFFTSHEALLLPYEEALTRIGPGGRHYNLSTHFPWVGMRTSDLEGAHVEYVRGLSNPIALKVGPGMSASDLKSLIRVLDPDEIPGRLTLISRLGVERIETLLPPLIEAVRASGRTVLWSSDPMHGNTEMAASGVKTRRFENVLSELELSFDIHAAAGSNLGGVHLELTGENVTECTGGAAGLQDEDLRRAYRSHVDPRLNGEQGLEMAFSIIRKHRRMGA
jgi:3-deoxy-7-phosphoheptulonate synthase